MEKSMPGIGMEPPPYSAVDPSQEYIMRSSVLPTAPYPTTTDYHQVSDQILAPPPFYYNTMPASVGTSRNEITMPQSNHNPIYTPQIYNPATVTVTPGATSQLKSHWGITGKLLSKIFSTLIVIVILIIIGITIAYFVEEVF